MSNRKITMAANWKMNKILPEAIDFVQNLPLKGNEDKQIVIGCPFVFLDRLAQIIDSGNKNISLAAQDCSAHLHGGAFTGEVSAEMIKSVGADFVILGHSERRKYHQETDSLIAQKVNRALESGLNVIWCCGETIDERKSGNAEQVVREQMEASLGHLIQDQWKNLIIAYEPVWAIGTGEVATPEMAEEMHAFIRTQIPGSIADSISILYGGSMKPANAKDLLLMPNVDGGLVGGASLKTDSFYELIES